MSEKQEQVIQVGVPVQGTNGAGKPFQFQPGEYDVTLGIVLHELSAERVVASIPVAGNRQAMGLMHGGALMALGETVGGWGALAHADVFGKQAVGVDINATHHRSARDGRATATATAIKLGRTVACYDVVITDDNGKRLSSMRVTNAIVEPRG